MSEVKKIATRESYGNALIEIGKENPNLVVLDADLAAATKTGMFKKVFPERHIHEFRYTFITRAKECGVNPEVVMLWAGHESDSDVKTSKVDRGYTTYSEEYLLSEINKISYDL